jgi:hypothetical protein
VPPTPFHWCPGFNTGRLVWKATVMSGRYEIDQVTLTATFTGPVPFGRVLPVIHEGGSSSLEEAQRLCELHREMNRERRGDPTPLGSSVLG